MKKTFILDTNVLLHDANSIFSFEDNDVVLPIVVLEELDNFKKRQDETGRNSRLVVRELDKLRDKGHLNKWVELPNKGRLKVDLGDYKTEINIPGLDKKNDNVILGCLAAYAQDKEIPAILISKDINLRVKADALGLSAEGFDNTRKNMDEVYSGVKYLELDSAKKESFTETNKIDNEWDEMLDNEFVIFNKDDENPLVGRYIKEDNKINHIKERKESIWGLGARNVEQQCAIDMLLDDKLQLVSLVGKAGTGKTILALACGLESVVQRGAFQRLLICRPIIPVGKDIGFLPGDVMEKMMPRMQPISDNLEYLFNERTNQGPVEDLEYFLNEGIIELEPLTYIRGRSIPNQYMIVDEAQNLTPLELKTIITRAGLNTKIVLTGDPYQIDHPYLDFSSNGLTYVLEKFAGQKVFGHVILKKGERSGLAELAAELM